jgi:heat shock protein HslJ
MKNLSIIILFSIISISCNSKKETTKTNNQNINRVWMLVSFKNYTKEDLVKKNAFLDLTSSERASAKMGCNNLSFSYKISEDTITFSQGISTKMYCQDMSLEDDFSKDITSFSKFTIEGHKLILSSTNGEKIEFVAQDWD